MIQRMIEQVGARLPLEIFSLDLLEPWVLTLPDVVWVASPDAPDAGGSD